MKTHEFDSLSFVGGLTMTLVGLLFLIPPRGSGLVDLLTGYAPWIWPGLLLIVGFAILLSAIPGWRRDPRKDASQDL